MSHTIQAIVCQIAPDQSGGQGERVVINYLNEETPPQQERVFLKVEDMTAQQLVSYEDFKSKMISLIP